MIAPTETGWTEEEREAWEALAVAATKVMALPQEHPMEGEEQAHAFHEIQRALLARPTRRAYLAERAT